MRISKDKFEAIGKDLGLSSEKVSTFWDSLSKSEEAISPFAHTLYFFGAMVVISAMTWFMNLGWEIFGGGGIFFIAAAYAFLFFLIGSHLWHKKELKTPGGLLITMGVAMVPLAIYGLEIYFNLWQEGGEYRKFYASIDTRWIWMELGTIAAGLLALYYFPFPFLTTPIVFSIWYLSMDSLPYLFGPNFSDRSRAWVTLMFGLGLLAIGLFIDHRHKRDFGFWIFLWGTLLFWAGFNFLMWDKSELVLIGYLLLNLLMMGLSLILRRKVLMVFGALGVFAYLSHLAYSLFADSPFFPFILSLIGLIIIYLGVLYQRNQGWIERNLLNKLPASIKINEDEEEEEI